MLIAQLSDPHLRPRGLLYQGLVDSNAMFAVAVRHLNALRPRPDVVILSGDVVDEGQPEEYEAALAMLSEIETPLLIIPGNHDEREAFRHAFSAQAFAGPSGPLHVVAGSYGAVRIVGLDVTVPGEHHGDMDDAAVAWLEATLAAEPDRPTVIVMHQPPFSCAMPYLDDYLCRQGERLAAVVSRYPAVERVLCGHVHRLMHVRFAGTIAVTAPSTTTAIDLRLWPDAEPASFIEPPGLLLHHWREETGIVTHFVPIGTFAGPLPFA